MRGWYDIGSRIIRERERHGWTQDQLAQKVGVTHTVISKWERGTRHPTEAHIEILAEALNCQLLWLLTGNPISPRQPIPLQLRPER